jgi:hypothetical protein
MDESFHSWRRRRMRRLKRFLADPKHSMHFSHEERRELTEAISELRKKLEDVRR